MEFLFIYYLHDKWQHADIFDNLTLISIVMQVH